MRNTAHADVRDSSPFWGRWDLEGLRNFKALTFRAGKCLTLQMEARGLPMSRRGIELAVQEGVTALNDAGRTRTREEFGAYSLEREQNVGAVTIVELQWFLVSNGFGMPDYLAWRQLYRVKHRTRLRRVRVKMGRLVLGAAA